MNNKIQNGFDANCSSANDVCELNDNDALDLVKKRLFALNSLDMKNDLINFNEISIKYNINPDILLEVVSNI